MKYMYLNVFAILLVAILSTSCEDVSDLAVDRVAAPVLGVELNSAIANGVWKREVAFYELDKSGILDHTVGIDSIPVANLALQVLTDDNTLVDNLTTDANGLVMLEKPIADFEGDAPSLQWVGNYKGVAFRIYDAQLK